MSDAAKAAENEAGKTGETEGAERTFTQAEVEAMIRGRLAKFSDYDTLKTELEELRKQGQSEQERAVEEARKQARAETLAEVNSRLVMSEARAAASEAGWLYPQDAHRYIDAANIAVNEDGTVDADALKSALADAVKDRPALVKKDTEVPDPSNAGIGVSAPSKPSTLADAWARDIG